MKAGQLHRKDLGISICAATVRIPSKIVLKIGLYVMFHQFAISLVVSLSGLMFYCFGQNPSSQSLVSRGRDSRKLFLLSLLLGFRVYRVRTTSLAIHLLGLGFRA